MYKDHVGKSVKQEHYVLSTVQSMHWTGFHIVGAAPGLMPGGGGRFAGKLKPWEETHRAGMEGDPAADQQHGSGGQQSNGERLEHGLWTDSLTMPYAVSEVTLSFYSYMESHKFRLADMDATFCWDKGAKASKLMANCWDASVHSSFLQKRLNFACAVSMICATLHCGTQHIKVLTLKC